MGYILKKNVTPQLKKKHVENLKDAYKMIKLHQYNKKYNEDKENYPKKKYIIYKRHMAKIRHITKKDI